MNVWSIFDLVAPDCPACGLATPRRHALCPGCRADLPPAPPAPGGRLVVACAYAFPADRLIQRLKFGGCQPLAVPLGLLLADAVRRRGAPLPAALIPVPLHPARERQRGFNQARNLARAAGDALGIAVRDDLARRRRDTAAQTGLDRAARRRNLHGAFAAGGAMPMHVAIVDDVITTGSTARALAHALRLAGARQIDVWAVARAI